MDAFPAPNKRQKREALNVEGRSEQLLVFRDEFGHCEVPWKYPVGPSLGQWCISMSNAYNQIQTGRTTSCDLSQNRIERLEQTGFLWKPNGNAFEQRYRDLEALKSEFGYCNVHQNYSVDPSLGICCSTMRCACKQIQQGMKPTTAELSQDRIEHLEGIGFKWIKIRDLDHYRFSR